MVIEDAILLSTIWGQAKGQAKGQGQGLNNMLCNKITLFFKKNKCWTSSNFE